MASDSIFAFAACDTASGANPVPAGYGATAAQRRAIFCQAVAASESEERVLRAYARWIPAQHAVQYVALLRWHAKPTPSWMPLHSEIGALPEPLKQQLIARAGQRCREPVVSIEPACDGSPRLVAMATIPGETPCREALVAVAPQIAESHAKLGLTLELAATGVWLWRLRHQANRVKLENRAAAALIELLDRMAACDNLQLASATLVQSLREFLKCERVVVGLCPSPERPCRILADSQNSRLQRDAEDGPMVQAALDEVIFRGSLTVWPAKDGTERHGMLTLKQLADKTDSAGVVGAPMRDERGVLCGAWLFLGDAEFPNRAAGLQFIRAAERPVGTSLRLQQRSGSGRLSRWLARGLHWSRRRPGRLTLIACGLAAILLACPARYRVKCDCELQPVTRRFVAAPFDGKLERSFVEPGDLVRKDQRLANMDGREIRWEFAGVAAEAARAEKQHDGYLAAGEFGPAELTKYEIERLRVKTELLEHRSSNLEIQSPLDGIVIRGDLKKAEGAPVQIGQTLFEVAPLDRMIVEIAIPAEDIVHVWAGAAVEVSLEAFPGERWQGTLTRLHPRSEIKDEAHVFLGEMVMETSQRGLRPGCAGRRGSSGRGAAGLGSCCTGRGKSCCSGGVGSVDERRDESTRELTSARLILHEDVIFSPRRSGNTSYYCVEHPSRGKFFRIGPAEYTFVSLLDGNTTVAETLTLTARRCLGPDAFNEREAIAICKWLLDSGLARPAESAAAAARPPAEAPRRARGGFHPFWIKIPVCKPDRWLARIVPWVAWMHSGPAMAVALILGAVAVALLGSNWQRFTEASSGVFAPGNWISLAVTWLALKAWHELAHAVVCKKYGGEVRETGLILILFTPVAYVDVTSCWRFRSKWSRIHTAAAGIYSELVVASIAAIGWSQTSSAQLQHVLYNLIFMASLTTIVFNANPLMRFDGYFVLADWLEIPNLYSRGSRCVQQMAARWFLGRNRQHNRETGVRGALIRGYGIAAFLWRCFVCVSLTIAAAALFHGAGILLAALGVVLWLRRPAQNLASELIRLTCLQPQGIARFVLVTASVSILAAWLLWLPWPFARTAPGIVEYTELAVVRARCSGFVDQLMVRDGQPVQSGQPLVILKNADLQVECRDLELAIEQATARHNIHLQKNEVAAAQVEWEKRLALEKRLAESNLQRESLVVRAPQSGLVMAWDLGSLVGTRAEEGQELLAIGDPTRTELRVAVAEPDAQHFAARVGQRIGFRLRSRERGAGLLRRLTPSANIQPDPPALGAHVGGPLPVKCHDREDDEGVEYLLTRPRFSATIAIDRELPGTPCAGEYGVASIHTRDQSIGQVLYNGARGWIRDKFVQSERAKK